MTKTPEEILEYAKKEADKAAIVALMGDKEDMFCGFAWVRIRPARGKFVNYLKAQGIGELGVYGGWEISDHEYNPRNTQSMTFKEIVGRAFANALKECGVAATLVSRAD